MSKSSQGGKNKKDMLFRSHKKMGFLYNDYHYFIN